MKMQSIYLYETRMNRIKMTQYAQILNCVKTINGEYILVFLDVDREEEYKIFYFEILNNMSNDIPPNARFCCCVTDYDTNPNYLYHVFDTTDIFSKE